MGTVIKRSGRRQAFSAAKVRSSVEKAAKDGKVSTAKRRELQKEVADSVIALYKRKRTVRVTDLRKSLLRRLDRRAKAVSAAWRRYDRRVKRTVRRR